MQFKRQQDNTSLELDLVPMIDVVFMLLIFFMVATTFDKTSHIVLEFPSPSKSSKPLDKTKDMIEITIDDKGNYFVNHQQLINSRRESLKRALKVAIEGKQNIGSVPVVISAHAKAKHQAVVDAMYTSHELGLINVLFSTVKSGSGKTP